MSKLETIISDLYQGSITEKEVKEASENLIKFFKILLEIKTGEQIFSGGKCLSKT